MPAQKKTKSIICGFEKKNLDTIKINLETLLNREHILDNLVIQECFNKEILGFSLDSVSNLEELKEIGLKLFGKDINSDKKELMLAICLGAGMSEILNLSIHSKDGNEISLDIFHSSENNKFNEEESMNNLLKTSELIMEFLETGREKDIFIKPIFKADRTTLILRDLESDVIEDEIFDLLKNCPHFFTEEFASSDKTPENSADVVRKLVVDFRKEVHGTWFITLKTEDLTTKVALWLRNQKLREGSSSLIKVGIKSEHPIASLLSVLSMNKNIQPVVNGINNLHISGAKLGIEIPQMMTNLHASFSNRPQIISSNEVISLNVGKSLGGTRETKVDDLSSHCGGVVVGNINPKMGYMNIPVCSNTNIIHTHNQVDGTGLENQQLLQSVGSQPQKGIESLNIQNPEHIVTSVPMIYPYHGVIGRTMRVPDSANSLNAYGSINGTPDGGIIAPVVVVPGSTIPGALPTSPSSLVIDTGSPILCKADAPPEYNEADYLPCSVKSPGKNDQKRRGSRVSNMNECDARNSSPNNTNRINDSETIPNVLKADEIKNSEVSPVVDGTNSAVKEVPRGAATLIHGIAPFYYGVSGLLPEIQPVNLQYIGTGPHPGHHHSHIFIHGNPQFQYQHQMDFGISGAIQGCSGNFESGLSNTKLDSDINNNNGQHTPSQMPSVLPTGYYHNAHYIGEDSLGFMGSHGFSVGNFAFDNKDTLISPGGGNNTSTPENLVNQGLNYWVRSPVNNSNTKNQRFRFNGRKNNGSSSNRTSIKSGNNLSNIKKNNNPKSSGNGGNLENPNFEAKIESKTETVCKFPKNDTITKNIEVDQYEHEGTCSTKNSKRDPNYKKENAEFSLSEGIIGEHHQYETGDPENTSFSGSLTEVSQNQSCKKLANNSSTIPLGEFPDKQQTSNKTFKPFINSGNKSKSHKNIKKSSNGNGTSGNKGNFVHSKLQPNANTEKSRMSGNIEGDNLQHFLEAETVVSDHRKKPTSKQINVASNKGDRGNFSQKKYSGYENNHLRLKRTTGNEQSHFNFNGHKKHSFGNFNGTGGSNNHSNQINSYKGKGHITIGIDQEAKGIGLENFPSLSDAIATRK